MAGRGDARVVAPLLAAALLTACRDDAAPPAADGAASASASAPPVETFDPPPPSSEWSRASLGPATALACAFFAEQRPAGCRELRPVAAFQRGERGFVRAYRAVDPRTGAWRPLKKWKFYGKVDKVDDFSLLELTVDGVAHLWVVIGSLVLEAEDAPERADALREAFVPWVRETRPLMRAPGASPPAASK
jgi:hypothetical protein